MYFFEKSEPEDFLTFMRDFQKMIKDTGATTKIGRIRYLRTLLRGEVLHEFETILEIIKSTTKRYLTQITLELGTYSP